MTDGDCLVDSILKQLIVTHFLQININTEQFRRQVFIDATRKMSALLRRPSKDELSVFVQECIDEGYSVEEYFENAKEPRTELTLLFLHLVQIVYHIDINLITFSSNTNTWHCSDLSHRRRALNPDLYIISNPSNDHFIGVKFIANQRRPRVAPLASSVSVDSPYEGMTPEQRHLFLSCSQHVTYHREMARLWDDIRLNVMAIGPSELDAFRRQREPSLPLPPRVLMAPVAQPLPSVSQPPPAVPSTSQDPDPFTIPLPPVDNPEPLTMSWRPRSQRTRAAAAAGSASDEAVDERWKCSQCTKVLSSKVALQRHEATHDKKFICPVRVCGLKVSTKFSLQNHITVKHPEYTGPEEGAEGGQEAGEGGEEGGEGREEGEIRDAAGGSQDVRPKTAYSCTDKNNDGTACTYRAPNLAKLKTHRQKHVGELQCPRCGKMLSLRGREQHLEKNRCKPPIKCDQCFLYFENEAKIIQHLRKGCGKKAGDDCSCQPSPLQLQQERRDIELMSQRLQQAEAEERAVAEERRRGESDEPANKKKRGDSSRKK